MCWLIFGRMEWRVERNINVRETHGLVACCTHPGRASNPRPRRCALTGNQTPNLLVYRVMIQPTEPHQPGSVTGLYRTKVKWVTCFIFVSKIVNVWKTTCDLSWPLMWRPGTLYKEGMRNRNNFSQVLHIKYRGEFKIIFYFSPFGMFSFTSFCLNLPSEIMYWMYN